MPNRRDQSLYPTVLDADLAGNDTSNPATRLDNSGNIIRVGETGISAQNIVSAVILDGIQFKGASIGAAWSPVSAVTLAFRGCEFHDYHGRAGSAVKHSHGRVILEDCTIRDNVVALVSHGIADGGAVNAELCIIEISNTQFKNNTQPMWSRGIGAAIALRGCIGSIRDSHFEYNISDLNGGAMFIDSSGIAFSNTRFNHNISRRGSAGAVYIGSEIPRGEYVFDSCEFELNQADLYAGAVFALQQVEFQDSQFVSNDASFGGAVGGWCHLRSSIFTKNTGGNGGAASLSPGSLVSNCLFESNSANSGGAISFNTTHLRSTPVVISQSEFVANEADRGGAVWDPYADADDGDVEIVNSRFTENEADVGGAIHGTNLITSSIFDSNQSGGSGGAVAYVERVKDSQFVNNTAGSFGGAAAYIGSVTRCRIVQNDAYAGGGVYDATEIVACLFYSNSAQDSGAACTLVAEHVLVADSVLVNNTTPHSILGSALYRESEGVLDLLRCTIVNTIPGGELLLDNGVGSVWVESTIIRNDTGSIFPSVSLGDAEQTVFLHSNYEPDAVVANESVDIFDLGGNINADPLFQDASIGNVRLETASPCIDAGLLFTGGVSSSLDAYGEPRNPIDDPGTPNTGQGAGGYLDIGAVEFQGTTCLADTNRDGTLAPNDFTAWIAAYNALDPIADQNRDGYIDPGDYTAWINNYITGCP